MKIAVIGAASGQLPLCLKAREAGYETICFAWEKGAVCKEVVDRFYPVSVLEKDRIVELCRQEQVNGVVTNASDLLAEICAYVSGKLGLHGNDHEAIRHILDKNYVRAHTEGIEGLGQVRHLLYEGQAPEFYPCVVKPDSGSSKQGVSFVQNREGFEEALAYASAVSDHVLVEEYIEGREISVESLSYEGRHQVLQVTDKDSSGYPHFVELGHHQPAELPQGLRERIDKVVPAILDRLDFRNGASHVEFRISPQNELFLIEVNPRGGGDHISDRLVELSTGYDYLKAMIEVAAGCYRPEQIGHRAYAGIYYLCRQNEGVLPLFQAEDTCPWLVEKQVGDGELTEASGNYDRNGYLIYSADRKIK